MSVINTNVASMNTRRNLSTSQGELNTSIQRLSSGLRVNSAKDDAAGLAIATRMDAQIRGQTVAMRNANDAISFSQTAEGALSKVGDALQRMRELAVQSANATNSGADRSALNKEFTQLQSEVTRLTNTTKFNSQVVLAGGTKTFQVGADTTDTIDVSGVDLTAATSETAKATVAVNSLNRGGTIDANGNGVASAENTAAVGRLDGDATFDVSATTIDASNPAAPKAVAGTITVASTMTKADQDIAKTNMEINRIAMQAALDVDPTLTTANFDLATQEGGLDVGLNAATQASNPAAHAAYTAAKSEALKNAGSAFDAHNAIGQLDKALGEVNTARANFGAVQNRFSSVIGNLQVSVENQSASMSRIKDADFAVETAKLARGQILQQAGTAMLAQANSLPNGVLALLRG